MTLVLALRGIDGVVIAADTKGNETHSAFRHNAERLESITSGRHASKIFTSKRHGIMAAFAESDEARFAARIFIKKIDSMDNPPRDTSELLESSCREACAATPHGGPPGRSQTYYGSVIAVNVANAYHPITCCTFHLRLDGAWFADCLPVQDNHIAGLTTNSALFFLEQYYSFSLNPQPVERLIPIAGHIILAASRLTGDRIDGLEMAACKTGGKPVFIQKETMLEVYARSEAINKGIGKLLNKPLDNIRFAEAPDEIVRPPFVVDDYDNLLV